MRKPTAPRRNAAIVLVSAVVRPRGLPSMEAINMTIRPVIPAGNALKRTLFKLSLIHI